MKVLVLVCLQICHEKIKVVGFQRFDNVKNAEFVKLQTVSDCVYGNDSLVFNQKNHELARVPDERGEPNEFIRYFVEFSLLSNWLMTEGSRSVKVDAKDLLRVNIVQGQDGVVGVEDIEGFDE